MANEGMLAKVRALLDKAEATEFPKEAETYRAKAEELMRKYRIDQEDLLASGTEEALTVQPVPFDIVLGVSGQFINHYAGLFGAIAAHTGIRHNYRWSHGAEGIRLIAQGVGFDADVQFTELLFTQARLAFQERLEPKVDPELSDQVNVYRLRSAGMTRRAIADIMWDNTDKLFMGRVGRLYKAECAQRGEEPALEGRGVDGNTYRISYADHFVYQLGYRLRMARAGSGGDLVLGNREAKLSEAYYARFPHLRPKAEVESREPERCDKCAKAKSGVCREHTMPRGRVSKRDPYSAAAVRGAGAGRAAARTVDLGRGGPGSHQIGG